MSVSSEELSPAARAAPAVGRGERGVHWSRLRHLSGPRLYVGLIAVAVVIASLSLLIPSTPSYDPWAWIVWGREIVHLDLHTTGGPSWKPLPVIFTTLFAPFGRAAPDMWLVVARTGALIAVAMSFKLAFRLTRSIRPGRGALNDFGAPVLAGAIAVLGLVSAGGFVSDNALGYSEGLMAAVVLVAIDRHLDGKRRQAFAVAFAAALDRPEIWPFWGLYGLYLWWRDPGARKLVAALFAATPLLWFVPELWGSGHLFRGVNRAHHPRSNSAAYASCPFCSELKDHAWKLLLLRVKILAALAFGVAAFRVWRRRADGIARAAVGPDGSLLAVGALGIAWILLISVMTQAGFSGNNRYLVLGAALINVVGGVGWGWGVLELGSLGRRVTGAVTAGAGALVAAVAVFMFVPSWIGANVIDLPATHKALNYQARLRSDLGLAIKRAGGAGAVKRCGTVMTEGFQVPMVAWELGVHTIRVEAPPVSGPPRPPLPNVILQARANGNIHTALLPRLPHNAGYRLVTRTKTFRVYEKCG